jgi:hypothetical protein
MGAVVAEPCLHFEIISRPSQVELIASGAAIRCRRRLHRAYGGGRWRKLKAFAIVRLPTGRICWAEIHWYEAHGLGRKELKIKRIVRELQ